MSSLLRLPSLVCVLASFALLFFFSKNCEKSTDLSYQIMPISIQAAAIAMLSITNAVSKYAGFISPL